MVFLLDSVSSPFCLRLDFTPLFITVLVVVVVVFFCGRRVQSLVERGESGVVFFCGRFVGSLEGGGSG